MKTIDCQGLNCPEPVIRTKEALKKHDSLLVIVDNKSAAENVARMAKNYGCRVEMLQEQGNFKLKLETSGTGSQEDKAGTEQSRSYLITSESLGEGPRDLGELLMTGFLKTLKEVEPLPETLLFMNEGVKLVTVNDSAAEIIRGLPREIDILVCGTCLDYFELTESLKAGRVSNMYEILDTITRTSCVKI